MKFSFNLFSLSLLGSFSVFAMEEKKPEQKDFSKRASTEYSVSSSQKPPSVPPIIYQILKQPQITPFESQVRSIHGYIFRNFNQKFLDHSWPNDGVFLLNKFFNKKSGPGKFIFSHQIISELLNQETNRILNISKEQRDLRKEGFSDFLDFIFNINTSGEYDRDLSNVLEEFLGDKDFRIPVKIANLFPSLVKKSHVKGLLNQETNRILWILDPKMNIRETGIYEALSFVFAVERRIKFLDSQDIIYMLGKFLKCGDFRVPSKIALFWPEILSQEHEEKIEQLKTKYFEGFGGIERLQEKLQDVWDQSWHQSDGSVFLDDFKKTFLENFQGKEGEEVLDMLIEEWDNFNLDPLVPVDWKNQTIKKF